MSRCTPVLRRGLLPVQLRLRPPLQFLQDFHEKSLPDERRFVGGETYLCPERRTEICKEWRRSFRRV